MKHGLYLLHRLVFLNESDSNSSDELTTDFDLRYKLHTPPLAVFNGLPHMFTVMIGRLSYADPPDWLSADLRNDIEKMTGRYSLLLVHINIKCKVQSLRGTSWT